ncbi:Protein of uncharacterised function (DUF2543) [Cedecea neteri]|uniref:Protein of uncharacterized function (DUF2543) n=1 Tax=Cedecea neteri TaxID=158822 RepID=A0A2X3IZA7_9ENTR|nr:Protein of uncharacterised function (DUF2543) [Cedecea neteri]
MPWRAISSCWSLALMNNEEISEEAQGEMAVEAGLAEQRIDEIAEFLNQWGNE